MNRPSLFLFLFVAMLPCLGSMARAQNPPTGDQWPRRFFIGVGHVRCDLPPTAPLDTWPNYIQSVENHTQDWQSLPPEYRLPLSRFTQLEELGVDLAEITIHPDHLIPPPICANLTLAPA